MSLPVGEGMVLTVTAQNATPYITTIPVMPPAGAYLLYQSNEVNDELGNGDGLLNNGEAIKLGVGLVNVGPDDALEVVATLSSTDAYVTITDNSESYGTIAGNNGVVSVSDAFGFTVSGDIPDGHGISFRIESHDGFDSVWSSNLSLVGHSPVLEYVSVAVDDAGGNGNGILDPGETATLRVTLRNGGSARAYGVSGVVSEGDGYIEVGDDYGYYGDIARMVVWAATAAMFMR